MWLAEFSQTQYFWLSVLYRLKLFHMGCCSDKHFCILNYSQLSCVKEKKKDIAFVLLLRQLEKIERKYLVSARRFPCRDSSKPGGNGIPRGWSHVKIYLISGIRTTRTHRLVLPTTEPTHGFSMQIGFLTVWWPCIRQTSYLEAQDLKH